jgi:iron complex outermembrane receptor protein
MISRSVLVCALAATAVVHAQPAPAPADWPSPTPSPAQCTGVVDGHVVDAATHEPIAAATVRTGDQLLAISDEAGRFTLSALCPGLITVIVEREDHKPSERTLTVADRISLEVALRASGEVIEIREKAPPPPEVRSTAVIAGDDLEKTRGKTFTDALAEVPGVTELRAATGVAKPIIRGQFGRRLLILVDDVRHRAQEWGLEHAPEIDPFIADKIRVVRGAGGVRYGSDAIGGVVLVDPPELRRDPGANGEAHLIGASNGRGGTFAGRLQMVLEQLPALSMQVEGSVKRLAAPESPTYALNNAGLFEWNAGVTVGYRARRAAYTLSYRHYDAELGVCSCLRVHNIDDFLAQARSGRPSGADEFQAGFALERPRQAVGHDTALARARLERDELGTLTATYSFQHDLRREYDVVRNADTAGAQFNFRLMTHQLDAAYEHNPVHLSEHWHLQGAAGLVGMAQIHNYSGLHLVPNYQSFSAGAYASERLVGHAVEFEAGARYDLLDRTADIANIDFLRLVRSGQLAMDACGSDIDPARCHSRFHTVVLSLGALYRFASDWTMKGEVSSASRAPNPDEQYLNGAAPTFPVLGLGKPDLRPETTYSSSLTLAYNTTFIKAEVSAFANRINNYIYFGPAIGEDGTPIFDVLIRGTFPRFTTRAVDALFYGADGGIELAPIPALEFGVQASLVRAKNVDDGSYLVFVPADHYRGSLTVHLPEFGGFTRSFATVSGAYVARQRRYNPIADFIPPPAAYFLLGAELGTETHLAGHKVRIALQGSNLTNARYRDYTSLMRYFADEPGWQALLRISTYFDSSKKGN